MGHDDVELAMFPLGSTVFPGQLVPLHVFEERYRRLLTDLTAPGVDPTFGTVLIDRGHEVGGGDHRVAVGTRMQILQAERFEDGRWGMVAVGIERLEVVRWLDDDPYPKAVIIPRVVRDTGGASLDALEESVFETLRLVSAIDGSDPSDRPELSVDPLVRLDQLAALAPLSAYDRQRILEATSTVELIRLLDEALVEQQLILGAQLGDW